MKSNGNKELIMAMEELEKERGISKEYLLESLEVALASAYKRNFDSAENVKIEMSIANWDLYEDNVENGFVYRLRFEIA